ncbi:M14-type cytosolic carboxypeptidase [Dasania sp. GY-MA-18]|uniref:M14-type cytosolic carboxypeptidase n=1 Tax=Dasania phycosphaerae TaxID=2950436 RepID=A0A9J6RRH6_9GAMM|nr:MULTISPECIES: M14-type cytosolic carboxypeptidase [Dasania]MCR8924228.1 M14-type cytosolic carboxypeptidase [Dasania sp. GY-MA-18]MCZ0866881.1 M14-type cytosolic carboxypeptidase [Dasania phycosphaerae]MCZ0870385.1 M14-type cytosolic carboxypeptidase [Dasania phycosphaerae]
MMNIDCNFDGGNIQVVDSSDSNAIKLEIKKDKHADYSQWFYFRAQLNTLEKCSFTIINAGQVSYPEAWDAGTIVASYDRQNWFRISTDYQQQQLHFSLTPTQPIIYFSLYIPYSYERHNDLIAWALSQKHCQLHSVGRTVEGRPVELLKITNNTRSSDQQDKKNIWIIARQHPAETMAEWYIEGLLQALLNEDNSLSRSLLANANFYIVANMNPDGSIAGNLRTNGAGVDLNRSWLISNPEQAPESAFVSKAMDKLGVDVFLDIHGDEEIPFVFAAGCQGTPNYSAHLDKLDKKFRKTLHQINPDFRVENGYPVDEPGSDDLSIACNQIGHRFNCLALTIEMPFKDNQYLPDPIKGWGTERCKALGQASLIALQQMLADI